jgi:two-component system response regulator AlgR
MMPPAATTLRVLIVDDEALARLRLRSLLHDEPGVSVVGEAADAEAALRQLQAAGPEPALDLLLLDIRMPGPTAQLSQHAGLHLAKALKAWPRPPAVVFVSAHAEHALAAFDLEAVDYLTKPVRRERLQAALQRVRQRLQLASEAAGTAVVASPALVITDRGRVLRLPVPELLYFKAELKYVTLRTAQRSHVLDESLSELEQRLAALQPLGASSFVRVHRNALVGLHAVRELAWRDGPAGHGVEPASGHASGPESGRAPGPESGRATRSASGRELQSAVDLPDGVEAAEGWAVRVAPVDEWLAVSRRQLAAVRAALARAEGAA